MARTVEDSDLIGYKVLTKDDQGAWEDDWSDELYATLEAANSDAEQAQQRGYEPLVVAVWKV